MEMSEQKLEEALARRRAKELELLAALPEEYKISQKALPENEMLIHVSFSDSLLKPSPTNDKSPKVLQFLITFDRMFPITPPIVQSLTNFTTPTLADQRDLTCEIMGKSWSPTYCLADLIQRIPGFIIRVGEETVAMQRKFYGCFHLGKTYDLTFWKSNDSFGTYKCEDINDSAKKLWIVVTESAWLLLEELKEGMWVLRVWATLYSLKEIGRNLDFPNNVSFEWYKPDKSETFKQEYYLEDAVACMQKIAKKIANLGIEVNYTGSKEEASSDIDIITLVAEIKNAEETLNKGLELDSLQKLLDLYQKAIEYYSAMGDAKYDVYLKKMQEIMQRGDIQQCMQKGAKT